MDGALVGEHGMGIEHGDTLQEELNGTRVDAMRQIKLALDRKGLLNSDKVFKLNIRATGK